MSYMTNEAASALLMLTSRFEIEPIHGFSCGGQKINVEPLPVIKERGEPERGSINALPGAKNTANRVIDLFKMTGPKQVSSIKANRSKKYKKSDRPDSPVPSFFKEMPKPAESKVGSQKEEDASLKPVESMSLPKKKKRKFTYGSHLEKV